MVFCTLTPVVLGRGLIEPTARPQLSLRDFTRVNRIDLVDMSTCCDEIKQHAPMGRVTKLNFTTAVRPVWEAQGNKLDSDPSNKSPAARRRNRHKPLSGAAKAKPTSTMSKPISAANAAKVEAKFNNVKREFSAQNYSRLQRVLYHRKGKAPTVATLIDIRSDAKSKGCKPKELFAWSEWAMSDANSNETDVSLNICETRSASLERLTTPEIFDLQDRVVRENKLRLQATVSWISLTILQRIIDYLYVSVCSTLLYSLSIEQHRVH
jgi:hypothetical protein